MAGVRVRELVGHAVTAWEFKGARPAVLLRELAAFLDREGQVSPLAFVDVRTDYDPEWEGAAEDGFVLVVHVTE